MPRRPSSTHGLPDITPLLTPEQYRLITRSRRQPLIIQGRAGSGKTSVALFRIAWLAYPEAEPGEEPIDQSKVLIVMFNKALSTFAAHSLEPLGLEGVNLDTFHGWALTRIREAYAGTLDVDVAAKVEGRDAATRVKKHTVRRRPDEQHAAVPGGISGPLRPGGMAKEGEGESATACHHAARAATRGAPRFSGAFPVIHSRVAS